MIDYFEKKQRLKAMKDQEMNDPSLKGFSDKKKRKIIEKRKRTDKLAVEDRISHLERMAAADENDELNTPFTAIEEFSGPLKNRKRTDIRWGWAMLTLIGFFVIHGFSAFGGSNAPRSYAGLDFRDRPCGIGNLTIRPYLYWPHPNVDLNIRMCVSECPKETGRKICLYHPDGKTLHIADKFCYTAIQTQKFGRYCVPREPETKLNVDTWIVSWENVYRRTVGDLAMSMDIIMVGFVVTMIFGLLVLLFMSKSCLTKIWLWLSILITLNSITILAVFCHFEYLEVINERCYQAIDQNNCGGKRSTFFFFLRNFFAVVGIIYLVGIMYFCRKLFLAMKIMKKASFLFARTWQMKWITTLGSLAVMGMTFFFLQTAISATTYGPSVSMKGNIADGSYKEFEPNTIHRIVLWFDIILVYLSYLFIIAIVELVASYSTASWYYTRKKREAVLPSVMIMKTAIYYHVGTAAKLAIMKLLLKNIRNFAWMIKKFLKSCKQDRDWIRFAIATFLPLLTWYEKTLKFISKDAWANVAIWGEDYKTSSKRGYYLTRLRHYHEGYSVIPYIRFLLLSSKISLAMISASFVYGYCSFMAISPSQFDITIMDTPIVPYIFTFITTLFLSSIFFAPFDMLFRSTLQAYAVDSEMFVGNQRFTEPYLQKFFNELEKLTATIQADNSIFCFGCLCRKKGGASRVNPNDIHVEYEEDDDDLLDEEEKRNTSEIKQRKPRDIEGDIELNPIKINVSRQKKLRKGESQRTVIQDELKDHDDDDLFGSAINKIKDGGKYVE